MRALPVPIGPRAPRSRRREISTRALRSQSRCEARRRNRSAAPRATFACGTYRRATLARATTGRTAAADMVMADIFRESVRAKMGSPARIRPSSPAPDKSRSHTDSPSPVSASSAFRLDRDWFLPHSGVRTPTVFLRSLRYQYHQKRNANARVRFRVRRKEALRCLKRPPRERNIYESPTAHPLATPLRARTAAYTNTTRVTPPARPSASRRARRARARRGRRRGRRRARLSDDTTLARRLFWPRRSPAP